MKARLHIETSVKDGRTFLRTSYGTPPFKVADIAEDKKAEYLRLMLMSSLPGILDSDVYDIDINVAKNASLHLETQSYQRLFPMQQGASQQMKVHLAAGSRFCYLPHPVVPYQGSHFVTHTQVFLENDCTLIWGDVLTPGRQLHGEQFLFSKYHSLVEILKTINWY